MLVVRAAWLVFVAFGIGAASACGSSGGGGGAGDNGDDGTSGEGPTGTGGSSSGCSVSSLTCGDALSAEEVASIEPAASEYSEDGRLPCRFSIPEQSGGIFQVFCGGASLLDAQRATAEQAYPGATTETDTIGSKSFEMVVGSPGELGSTTEVAALTTSGEYVFDVSLTSGAADMDATRRLAEAIDANLSAR